MNQILSSYALMNAGVRDLTDLTNGEIKTITSFVATNEQKNPNATYLEVGVFAGSTIKFLKQFTKTTQFTGIDLFEDFEELNKDVNTHTSGTFTMNDVANRLGDRVTLLKGSSHTILPQLIADGKKYDHIFIDGNHSYKATKQDWEDCIHLLNPGGQISFHNASSHGGPDFELYVVADGGPWLVTKEIILSKDWIMTENVDRIRVFERK